MVAALPEAVQSAGNAQARTHGCFGRGAEGDPCRCLGCRCFSKMVLRCCVVEGMAERELQGLSSFVTQTGRGGSAGRTTYVPATAAPASDQLPSPPLPCDAEYETWLVKGVGGFRPPNEASRRALESETSLSIGSKKLPVEAGLRAAASDVSRTLCLDEVQAYILLRRWVAKAGTAGASGGPGGAFAGGGGIVVQPGAGLTPAQRLEVAQLYHAERLKLLKSIENLLWEGERK